MVYEGLDVEHEHIMDAGSQQACDEGQIRLIIGAFEYCLPFQGDDHPSPRKLTRRFNIVQVCFAQPTGMMYSGRVPSSMTEVLTT